MMPEACHRFRKAGGGGAGEYVVVVVFCLKLENK